VAVLRTRAREELIAPRTRAREELTPTEEKEASRRSGCAGMRRWWCGRAWAPDNELHPRSAVVAEEVLHYCRLR
jgi:hypothetical protein